MTEDELEDLKDIIDNEGFDYAFSNYSDFAEIRDKEFHKLRLKFLEARKELADYIGTT